MMILLTSITSFTATAPRHKRPIAVLTPTLARLRVADTPRPHARTLPPSLDPEKRPTPVFVLHLCGRQGSIARVRRARTVRRPVCAVVGVVGGEDGEGLRGGGAGVVGTLGGLDLVGDFGCGAGRVSGREG